MLRKKAPKEGGASLGSTGQLKPNPLLQKALGVPKVDLSKFPLNKDAINKQKIAEMVSNKMRRR